MKIVFPTESKDGFGAKIAEHFGRCQTYTFLDEKGSIAEVIANTSEHMGGTGLPPKLMKKHGANALVCRGIGPKAISLCNELGINVFICKASTVRGAFDEWKQSRAKEAEMEDSCGHWGH